MAGSRKFRHRTLEERLKAYSEVRELRTQGIEPRQIAQTLGISLDDVRYWLRVNRPSREVYVPDLTPRPELAYLVGAYLGDGRTAGEKDKKVRFKVANIDFARQLNELVAKVLRTVPKGVTMERGFYCVNYDSAVLYDFLQQPVEGFAAIMEAYSRMFLRGFFDAEGYASPRLDHRQQRFQGITLGAVNTNSDYLIRLQKLLLSLGIRSRFVTTHVRGDHMTIRGMTFVRKHDVRHLVIQRREDVETYATAVGFAIPEKRRKLEEMIEILEGLTPTAGYHRFVSTYELRNRRWIRKE